MPPSAMERRIVNIGDIPLQENGNGDAFVARIGRAGPLIGLTGMGCTLTVVPPGKRAFPFHRHHATQEVFYVLSGEGICRFDGETWPVRTGDLIAAPAGKEAHQIVNTSAAELRYLAFSTVGEFDLIDYPDSGKIAAAAGVKNGDLSTATLKVIGRVTPADYFDGEAPKWTG